MTTGGHGTDGVERRGLMFVLSSPSGAGKTTLSRLLIDRMPGLRMSVSATTRAMRPGEVDGRDYLFVDKAQVRRDGEGRRAAGMGDRVRQPLRHAACAGRGGAVGGAGRAVRHRLAGHAAAAREGARGRRQRVHPAALGGRSREAAAFARAGFRRGDPQAHEPRQPRDEPLGRVRLHRHQPRRRRGLRRGAVDPEGRTPQARAADWPRGLRARSARSASRL